MQYHLYKFNPVYFDKSRYSNNRRVLQTLCSWSSTSTLVGHVGEERALVGKTIGKRETRPMDSMVEYGKYGAVKKSPRGRSYGHLMYWNRQAIRFSVVTLLSS